MGIGMRFITMVFFYVGYIGIFDALRAVPLSLGCSNEHLPKRSQMLTTVAIKKSYEHPGRANLRIESLPLDQDVIDAGETDFLIEKFELNDGFIKIQASDSHFLTVSENFRSTSTLEKLDENKKVLWRTELSCFFGLNEELPDEILGRSEEMEAVLKKVETPDQICQIELVTQSKTRCVAFETPVLKVQAEGYYGQKKRVRIAESESKHTYLVGIARRNFTCENGRQREQTTAQ